VLDEHEASDHRDTAARMWRAFLTSNLWTTLGDAAPVHTEYPVARLVDNPLPTHVRGTIDLLYRHDGGWHIVDFKTDRLSSTKIDAVRDQYRPQLQQYADIWEAATDTTDTTLHLWLADLGRSVRVSRGSPSPPAESV
jgi:ATP-dependent helicase/nuclease subunit A